jgi:nitrite reductase/ring-hydroxylating ferredoxin subunit
VDAAGAVGAFRARAGAVAPGRALRLELVRETVAVAGFVVNHDGRHYAYVNRCPHAGTALDRRRDHFFSDDGRLLACGTHGAVFAPDTGVCVEGPCPGARLEPLRVEREGDDLIVTWPS